MHKSFDSDKWFSTWFAIRGTIWCYQISSDVLLLASGPDQGERFSRGIFKADQMETKTSAIEEESALDFQMKLSFLFNYVKPARLFNWHYLQGASRACTRRSLLETPDNARWESNILTPSYYDVQRIPFSEYHLANTNHRFVSPDWK